MDKEKTGKGHINLKETNVSTVDVRSSSRCDVRFFVSLGSVHDVY